MRDDVDKPAYANVLNEKISALDTEKGTITHVGISSGCSYGVSLAFPAEEGIHRG